MKLLLWSIWLCTLSVTLYSAKNTRTDKIHKNQRYRVIISILSTALEKNIPSLGYINLKCKILLLRVEVVLNTMVTTKIALIILQLKSSPCIDLNMHRWCSLNDTPGASFKPERVREISNEYSHKNCTHL